MTAFACLIIALFVIAGALGWFGHLVGSDRDSSADERAGAAVFYFASLLVGAVAIILLIGWMFLRLAVE